MLNEKQTSEAAAEKTYTIPEIAGILKISVRKAYTLCNSTKDFKVFRIGRCMRVKKESFDRWFDQSDAE